MTTATIVSTPLPPPDSKVSGLRIALDGGAMAELLARHLPDCARGELEMLACNPRYIRYKPGTTCLVQYELTLGDEHSGRLRTLAHARLYADDEAEARWASRSLRRLRDQARQLPGPPADRAALLPELKALVELYPVDHRMPGLLGAASLTTVPPSAPVTAVELVRYKPGRKAILRFRLGREPIHAMYGRVHSDGMGSALLKAGRAFVAAGVSTPAPLGYVPDLGLLFVDEASGMRLADLRGSALFEQWLRPVAEALAHLHGAPVLGLPPVVKRNKEG